MDTKTRHRVEKLKAELATIRRCQGACWETEDYFEPGMDLEAEAERIKAELATLPHLPNKAERKRIRQEKAKRR